jgi:hypothetical protein
MSISAIKNLKKMERKIARSAKGVHSMHENTFEKRADPPENRGGSTLLQKDTLYVEKTRRGQEKVYRIT